MDDHVAIRDSVTDDSFIGYVSYDQLCLAATYVLRLSKRSIVKNDQVIKSSTIQLINQIAADKAQPACYQYSHPDAPIRALLTSTLAEDAHERTPTQRSEPNPPTPARLANFTGRQREPAPAV